MRFQIVLGFQQLFIFLFSLILVEAQNPQPFELREGVVVNPVSKQVYVMNPKGGIDAIDLVRGVSIWHSDQAAKPLALISDRLIAQIEPIKGDNTLEVAILNVQNKGERLSVSSTKLPAEIKVTIDDTLTSSFHTNTNVSGGNVYLFWNHIIHPTREALEEDRSKEKKTVQESPKPNSGTLRINQSGEISSVSARQVPAGAAKRPPDLSEKERLAGIAGRQFISSDGNHILGSELIADSNVWDKYRWTIYERATGKRVGEIRNFQSQAPFFVLDTQIVVQTSPYSLQTEKGQIDEPLKIRALNLQTGQEIWSWEVRNTTYRGPTPP